jgi:hypothetical protein
VDSYKKKPNSKGGWSVEDMRFLINGNQNSKKTQPSKSSDKPNKNRVVNQNQSSFTTEKASYQSDSISMNINNDTNNSNQNWDIYRESFHPFHQNFVPMSYYPYPNYGNVNNEIGNNIVNPNLFQNFPENVLYAPQLQQIPQNQQYVIYVSDLEQLYQLFQSGQLK